MGDSRKSFFYNPFFRVSVYAFAWIFLKCFKLLVLLNPKWGRTINRYDEGHATAPAIIGFSSGLILAGALFGSNYENINWNSGAVLVIPLVYILLGLMGWLSLVKFRDYEREKYSRDR